MTNMVFPTGNTGSAPTAARSNNLLADDGTNTGSVTVATVLGFSTFADLEVGKTVGSNVNYFALTSATTSNYPTLGVAGSDTNIGMYIGGKGSGTIICSSKLQAPNGLDVGAAGLSIQDGTTHYMTLAQTSSGSIQATSDSGGTRNFWDENGTITIGGAPAGPTISSGSAVPSGAPSFSGTAGSLYLRTGGGANTSVYVYYGSAWHAITG